MEFQELESEHLRYVTQNNDYVLDFYQCFDEEATQFLYNEPFSSLKIAGILQRL